MLLSGEWTRNGLNVSTRRIEQQRVGKKQHNDTNIRVHTLEYLPKDVGFVCWCLKMFCVCGQSKNVCGGVDFLSKPADEKHTRRKHDRFKSIWPRRCGFSKKKKGSPHIANTTQQLWCLAQLTNDFSRTRSVSRTEHTFWGLPLGSVPNLRAHFYSFLHFRQVISRHLAVNFTIFFIHF